MLRRHFWPSRTVSARQRARSSMSVSPRWGDVIQICPLTKRKTKYVAPITERSTGASASNSVQTRADFLDELRKTKPQILELASASNGGAFYFAAATAREFGGGANITPTRRQPQRGQRSRSAIRASGKSLPRVQTSVCMSSVARKPHRLLCFSPFRPSSRQRMSMRQP